MCLPLQSSQVITKNNIFKTFLEHDKREIIWTSSNTANINVKLNCFSGNFCQGFEVNKREHKCKNFIMRTVSDQFSSWGPLNDPRCENLKLRYVYKIQGPVQTRYYIL